MKIFLGMLALAVASGASADLLVAPGQKANLSVDYTYESVGSIPGQLASAEWRVKRTLSTSVTLEAKAPRPISQMRAPTAEQTAAMEARAAAAQQVATELAPNLGNMADLAARAEALAAKCGDDQECFLREAQQLLAGSNAAQLGQAAGAIQENFAPAFTPDAPRYQVWQQIAQRPGTYSIDETLSVRSRDPICIGQARDTCTINEIRKGGGVAPARNGSGPAAYEVDSQDKTLMILLPFAAGGLNYTRTLTSTHPEDESGEFQAQLGFPGNLELPASHVSPLTNVAIELQPLNVGITGDTLPATGTRTFEATGSNGEKVTLTAVWRLAPQ